MNKKNTLFVVALLLLSSMACAQSIGKKEFTITVDEGGNAEAVEKYYFYTASMAGQKELEETVNRNGQDLVAWGAYNPEIQPHFEGIENILLEGFSFDKHNNSLELRYKIAGNYARIIKEDSRSTTWKVNEKVLRKFDTGTLIVIPKDTSITINLPATAEVTSTGLPPNSVQQKHVILLSDTSIGFQAIEYSIPKPIGQAPEIGEIAGYFSDQVLFAIIAVVVGVIAVGVWKRKTIAQKVENYIVEHSSLKGEEEELIELEEKK